MKLALIGKGLDWETIVPLISTFMKSYNHERYIPEAIESVLTQDFEDLELIIVDDASTDESRQIIERYAEQDSRVRVIFHEHNLGITRVVNDGIDAARGKYIAQLDSDDVWAPDKLRKQLAVVERDENVIVWSEGTLIDQNGQPLDKNFSELVESAAKKKSGNLFQTLLRGNYIFGSTLLYKRTNLGDLRYDDRFMYNNDYKFLLELARTYDFHYIAEPLAMYRIHGKNTLVGRGIEAEKRRRRAFVEEISILQEVLLQYRGELPNAINADIYGTIGLRCWGLGKYREARSSYLQAIRSNPWSWSTPAYVARIFTTTLRGLLYPKIASSAN
jgi:glycosyltransferase involved in cell wall biosynthesis